MNACAAAVRKVLLAMLLALLMALPEVSPGQTAPPNLATNEILIAEAAGKVQILLPGATDWILTQAGQVLHPRYRLKTGPNSRVVLRWSDQSVVAFAPLTELEILPPETRESEAGIHYFKGMLSFFHRGEPGRIRIIHKAAIAGVEGTEFVMAIDPANEDRTKLWVIDGKVRFYNDQGAVTITNGMWGVAETGKVPMASAGFTVNNVLQWCFYYPAVLDLGELPLAANEQQSLAGSVAAYHQGDVLAALANYPEDRQPGSDPERIYFAALLLSVGQADQAESVLAGLSGSGEPRVPRLASALQQLIAAVKRQGSPSGPETQLASEFLAGSYYEQSHGTGEEALKQALFLARRAVTNSPEFGFAWVRVAELEFSFGHTAEALDALNRGLALAPRNAEGLALKGFLLAAENRTREAIGEFNRALAVDPALGNAWLGRGLCRIKRGDLRGGREDLLVAAAVEPQRSMLRSYLGKAYQETGAYYRAVKELKLAKDLDLNDPTTWLYSALLDQQYNRINEGIRDLEKSQELNDNRRVYRSRLLLDQDRAVGSANLAALYRDAGMVDVSVREASKAVSYDYGNYSAHLFLANSYDELRDPNRINLRYETPAESEYLIANLLAPVGAGTLSQTISQQEYSKLFERDRLGVTSSTEYLSRGAWIEKGAQFGTFGNSAYAFEAAYRTDPGQRPNNDFEETELRLHLKQQLTPQDTLYLRAVYYEAEGGDLIQYYFRTNAFLGLRTKETQEPILSLGYHREWAPGIHTLVLANRLNDEFSASNPSQPTYFLIKPVGEPVVYAEQFSATEKYKSTENIYSAELQQIWQQNGHDTIVGVRYQNGDFHNRNLQTNPQVQGEILGFFDPTVPLADQDFHSDLERVSVYAYHNWQILSCLQLVGGVAYDWIKFPENFAAAPLSADTTTKDQISPKAGFIWTPKDNAVVRFAYTRSLAGASIDQTYLLEPSQVAGFNQTFRSIIPESNGGAEAGAEFETFGLSLENRFITGTYVGVHGQILNSTIDRRLGVFEFDTLSFFAQPSTTPDHLDYTERSLLFTINQLVGQNWSLGVSYRLTEAELHDNFTEIPKDLTSDALIGFRPKQDLDSTLHRVGLEAVYNNRLGPFGIFQAFWYGQSSEGYAPSLPATDFWQLNAFAGYRFPRRKVELRVGILNLTDQDYRLNPLTLYNDLPRERTFTARFQFNF